MKIIRVHCEGYKAFKGYAELQLAPTTVIFGRNNSGKTTLARLLPFASASALSGDGYSLRSTGMTFGADFRDLANIDDPHPRMSFGLQADSDSLEIQLQLVTHGTFDSIQVTKVSINGEEKHFALELFEHKDSLTRALASLTRAQQDAVRDFRKSIAALLKETLHIQSARPPLRESYESRASRDWSPEEIPFQLATNEALLEAVSDWYRRELDGVTIALDSAPFAFRLTSQSGGLPISAARAGRGTQAALSVVTALVAVRDGHHTPGILIIEEPEAHLHPSAHGGLADLVIAASRKVQVVIEHIPRISYFDSGDVSLKGRFQMTACH